MDNIRLILIMTLAFIGLLLYQAWQQDYGPQSRPVVSTTSTPGSIPATASQLPSAPDGTPNTMEGAPPSVATSPQQNLPMSAGNQLFNSAGRVQVNTDTLHVEIDLQGGDIRVADLLSYPVSSSLPDQPVQLMNDQLPNVFVLQTGFLGQPGDPNSPNHQSKTPYTTTQNSYELAPGSDTLDVVLTWEAADGGVQLQKIYHFQRGQYLVQLQHKVTNHSDKPWPARPYGQLQRTQIGEAGQSSFIYTYLGGAISTPESNYQKIDFGDIQEGGTHISYLDVSTNILPNLQEGWRNGWIAMLQHYFVASLVPPAEQTWQYYSQYLPTGTRYMLGMFGPSQEVAAGASESFDLQFYAGPKVQDKLLALSPGLELTVDYGFLWFIAQPLFWLLKKLYEFLGNWGWSIIGITILIKLAFFHLSATSYRSMAKMRTLQPRLAQLKERYGDDRGALNQAMMDMYKKEKINPLGGCLPVLVQIPVFIALYWMLLESVELRQAPFILWLTDLSIPDPYFILPLLMGASMLVQHRLNPAPLDPMQQKIMMALPIVFTIFFAFFPAGLVLYWTVNNLISISQQWYITRKIEAG